MNLVIREPSLKIGLVMTSLCFTCFTLISMLCWSSPILLIKGPRDIEISVIQIRQSRLNKVDGVSQLHSLCFIIFILMMKFTIAIGAYQILKKGVVSVSENAFYCDVSRPTIQLFKHCIAVKFDRHFAATLSDTC